MPEKYEGEMASEDVMSILSQSMTEGNESDTTDEGQTENSPNSSENSSQDSQTADSEQGEENESPGTTEVPEEGSQEGAGEQPDEDPGEPDNEAERYKYWQSKHDKLKTEKDTELSSYKQRLEQLENHLNQISNSQGQQQNVEPEKTIDEHISEKQQALNELDQSLETPPAKPSDYNEQDAYTDPDSPSFRYQRQLDNHNSKVTEYLKNRDKIKDELYEMKMQRVEEPAKKMAQEQQMSKQQKSMVDTLTNSYKLSGEQAQDFIRTMSDPKSASLDNLVNYYKFQKGLATPSSSQPNQKPSGKPNRKPNTVAAPPPAKGGTGGTGTDSPDEQTAFEDSLLAGSDLF